MLDTLMKVFHVQSRLAADALVTALLPLPRLHADAGLVGWT